MVQQAKNKEHLNHTETEKKVEEAAEELQVKLPEGSLTVQLKVIIVLILIGGLGIVANSFSDIFTVSNIDLKFYFLRMFFGFVLLGVAYGLIKRRRIAIWILTIFVAFAFYLNMVLSILPMAILVYLIIKRKYFYPSFVDKAFKMK